MPLEMISFELFGNRVIFYYRMNSHADCGVIHQIFKQEDYNLSHWTQGHRLMEYYRSLTKPALIVDAGANIGASALYFLNCYRNSLLFAVEPDLENWKLLELNTRSYTNRFCFLGGVADRNGSMFLQDPGLGEWGFRLASAGEKAVQTICVDSVMAQLECRGTTPLIMKIDIEGGEEFLFASNTDWISLFPVIIIELHDWMLPWSGSSSNFFRCLANREFDVVHRGENLFLFNREILGGK